MRVPQQADAALRERVLRHYRWCAEAIRDGDVDGFLDWLGPDGTFVAADGTTVRVADTRPFWEWRFANVIAVRRVEIEVESVAWNDDGLVVVDFHELSDLTVRGFDGKPVERDADLHNRNLWEISEDRLTTRGGEEVNVRRSLNGRPLSDEIDPLGFAAWARHQQERPG
jgi:hypothetical protein